MIENYLKKQEDYKYHCYGYNLISIICSKGNDISGSFMFEELENRKNDNYSLTSINWNSEKLEHLYGRKSRKSLFRTLCPDKKYFLEAIKEIERIKALEEIPNYPSTVIREDNGSGIVEISNETIINNYNSPPPEKNL